MMRLPVERGYSDLFGREGSAEEKRQERSPQHVDSSWPPSATGKRKRFFVDWFE
jgi:hypothetical protein